MCFFRKAHHSLIELGNTRQHFSTALGVHLKQQNHQKHVNMWKIWYSVDCRMALILKEKEHCLIWPQMGCGGRWLIFSPAAHACDWPGECCEVVFGITNKFGGQAHLQMWNLQTRRSNCICSMNKCDKFWKIIDYCSPSSKAFGNDLLPDPELFLGLALASAAIINLTGQRLGKGLHMWLALWCSPEPWSHCHVREPRMACWMVRHVARSCPSHLPI